MKRDDSGWELPRQQPITKVVVQRAEAAEAALAPQEHHAVDAWFDPRHDVVAIVLKDGRVFGAKRGLIPALDAATAGQLRTLRATTDGVFLLVEALDLHISVDGLVTRLLRGSPLAIQRESARLAGRSISAAKREASARNGRLGGRPSKPAVGKVQVA